ncbi:type II toxin-antitoxin system MqsA family antitoxin [Sorangium sp. So ce233]|uniref:type II toxin-antitoxin system MqsA family antitoxin n=1 Tax=Sorangium sp. So ce233 TaxID=3133290 RepID=UPI003F5FCBC9
MSAHENPGSPCPLCGGLLAHGSATIPFVIGRHVAVIKDVPAELCDTCGEPFSHAAATDVVSAMLARARDMGAEITVLTYPAAAEVAA